MTLREAYLLLEACRTEDDKTVAARMEDVLRAFLAPDAPLARLSGGKELPHAAFDEFIIRADVLAASDPEAPVRALTILRDLLRRPSEVVPEGITPAFFRFLDGEIEHHAAIRDRILRHENELTAESKELAALPDGDEGRQRRERAVVMALAERDPEHALELASAWWPEPIHPNHRHFGELVRRCRFSAPDVALAAVNAIQRVVPHAEAVVDWLIVLPERFRPADVQTLLSLLDRAGRREWQWLALPYRDAFDAGVNCAIQVPFPVRTRVLSAILDATVRTGPDISTRFNAAFDVAPVMARVLVTAEGQPEAVKSLLDKALWLTENLPHDQARAWGRGVLREVKRGTPVDVGAVEVARIVRMAAVARRLEHRFDGMMRRKVCRADHRALWRQVKRAGAWLEQVPNEPLRDDLARRRDAVLKTTARRKNGWWAQQLDVPPKV